MVAKKYHGRYHSCFFISWSSVITRRIYTQMLLRHQRRWWHMQAGNLLEFIQARYNLQHLSLYHEYEDSVLFFHTYSTVAFITLGLLRFLAVKLVHSDWSLSLTVGACILANMNVKRHSKVVAIVKTEGF